METNNNLFDAYRYFKALTAANRLCQENGFVCGQCSGIGGLEDAINTYRKNNGLVLVSDTTDSRTFSQGVTFFDENVYTVFIVLNFRFGDMRDRQKKLNLARRIFRQFHSKLIYDKNYTDNQELAAQLDFLKPDSVYSRELPAQWINGKTGLYFMLNNQEPIDLVYDSSEWIPKSFDETFDDTFQ